MTNQSSQECKFPHLKILFWVVFNPLRTVLPLNLRQVCGFFLAYEDWTGVGYLMNQSAPALFFFFFLVKINSHTPIALLRAGSVHIGLASRDDCGRAFRPVVCELVSQLVPTLCLDSRVSPFRLRWVKCECVFNCNLPWLTGLKTPLNYRKPVTCTFVRMTGVFNVSLR